jgi:hypothetical protein
MENLDTSIKNIIFKGFEEYDMSSFSFYLSENNRLFKMKYRKPLFLYFLKCFYGVYDWDYNHGDKDILFFCQKTRPQHLKMFKNLSYLIKGTKSIIFSQKRTFSVKEGFLIGRLLFFWLKSLKSTNLDSKEKLRFINELIRVKKLDFFIEKHIKKIGKPNLLISFYDAHGDANFVIQKFKRLGVTIATLSHGVVLAERDRNLIDYSGIELRGTTSDYFLAWNRFTLDEAKKQGLDINKFKILGIPHFINNNINKIDKVKNNVFGVVLDNKSGDDYNKKIIKYADLLSEKTDYKFIVRYHPNFKGNEYDNFIKNKDKYLGADSSLTIIDYAKKVEFTLIANSSVFIELVYLNHSVYRLRLNNIHDKYRTIKINSFHNEKELISFIENKIDNSNELFDYLCSVKNVQKSYTDFLNSYTN